MLHWLPVTQGSDQYWVLGGSEAGKRKDSTANVLHRLCNVVIKGLVSALWLMLCIQHESVNARRRGKTDENKNTFSQLFDRMSHWKFGRSIVC